MKDIIFKDISELKKNMTEEQKKEALEMFEKYYKSYCDIDILFDDHSVDETDYLKEVDLDLFD
jgi:hypothetical protein